MPNEDAPTEPTVLWLGGPAGSRVASRMSFGPISITYQRAGRRDAAEVAQKEAHLRRQVDEPRRRNGPRRAEPRNSSLVHPACGRMAARFRRDRSGVRAAQPMRTVTQMMTATQKRPELGTRKLPRSYAGGVLWPPVGSKTLPESEMLVPKTTNPIVCAALFGGPRCHMPRQREHHDES